MNSEIPKEWILPSFVMQLEHAGQYIFASCNKCIAQYDSKTMEFIKQYPSHGDRYSIGHISVQPSIVAFLSTRLLKVDRAHDNSKSPSTCLGSLSIDSAPGETISIAKRRKVNARTDPANIARLAVVAVQKQNEGKGEEIPDLRHFASDTSRFQKNKNSLNIYNAFHKSYKVLTKPLCNKKLIKNHIQLYKGRKRYQSNNIYYNSDYYISKPYSLTSAQSQKLIFAESIEDMLNDIDEICPSSSSTQNIPIEKSDKAEIKNESPIKRPITSLKYTGSEGATINQDSLSTVAKRLLLKIEKTDQKSEEKTDICNPKIISKRQLPNVLCFESKKKEVPIIQDDDPVSVLRILDPVNRDFVAVVPLTFFAYRTASYTYRTISGVAVSDALSGTVVLFTRNGVKLRSLTLHDQPITAMCTNQNNLYTVDKSGHIVGTQIDSEDKDYIPFSSFAIALRGEQVSGMKASTEYLMLYTNTERLVIIKLSTSNIVMEVNDSIELFSKSDIKIEDVKSHMASIFPNSQTLSERLEIRKQLLAVSIIVNNTIHTAGGEAILKGMVEPSTIGTLSGQLKLLVPNTTFFASESKLHNIDRPNNTIMLNRNIFMNIKKSYIKLVKKHIRPISNNDLKNDSSIFNNTISDITKLIFKIYNTSQINESICQKKIILKKFLKKDISNVAVLASNDSRLTRWNVAAVKSKVVTAETHKSSLVNILNQLLEYSPFLDSSQRIGFQFPSTVLLGSHLGLRIIDIEAKGELSLISTPRPILGVASCDMLSASFIHESAILSLCPKN